MTLRVGYDWMETLLTEDPEFLRHVFERAQRFLRDDRIGSLKDQRQQLVNLLVRRATGFGVTRR
jgi:hypothetical protein